MEPPNIPYKDSKTTYVKNRPMAVMIKETMTIPFDLLPTMWIFYHITRSPKVFFALN